MKKILSVVVLLSFLTACKSVKEIVYVQDIDEVQLHEITTRYEARIKKDDLLNIVVSGPDKQVVMPYNLTLNDGATGANGVDPERITLPYLVDINGEIDFPILGKLKVEGMTRSDLASYLTDEIGHDVKDPIVYVSFRNYKITILGEVKNPGTYSMDSEKINIFQALGRAGDLSLTAKREDIILIREVNGKNTHYKIDLKSANLMNEDFFYMQQNDVLYVPPSGQSISAATTNTGIWSVLLSSVASVIAVLTLILK